MKRTKIFFVLIFWNIGCITESNPFVWVDSLPDPWLLSESDFELNGEFSFQTCDDTHCLPPFYEDFKLKVKGCEVKDIDTTPIS